MGKGKKNTKAKVDKFKSDAGDISITANFGAKYRVEITEYTNSHLCGYGGVCYF